MPPIPKLTSKDRDVLEELWQHFLIWYKDPANIKEDIEGILENELENDDKAFVVKDFTLGLKKNIRAEIAKFDPQLLIQPVFNEEKKSNDYKVMKLSQSIKNKVETLKPELKKIQYNDAIGVSYLWEKVKEKIKKDKISVVGYNCLYDLTYWYSHFEGHLNKNYEVFKSNIREIFQGGIYDSKIISSYFEMDERTLEDMHQNLKGEEKSWVKFTDPLFDCSESKEHSSGKDAYMTGFAFLKMSRDLDTKTVNDLVNVVTINPNVLYAYNFGSSTHDVSWNSNAWVIFCKEDTAKQLRIQNNKKSNKKGNLEL